MKGRAAQKGRGRDQQLNEYRTGAELVECRAAAGRHERQTEVKVEDAQGGTGWDAMHGKLGTESK